MSWLADERGRLATERILDAAAELFVANGVGGVGMGEVARAAGCSRATLYRYFADRDELHTAFVHREARRVGAEVAAAVEGINDPARLVTEAVLDAVRRVRETPTLAAWFAAGDAARTSALAQSSAVIEALGMSVVDDADDARWLVRVILSLLTVPGRDAADERAMVERYVAPRVTSEA
ncbi:MAG TPA: TetR/AcrR family transcriptional regulator [Nocardioides sp.]|nr:TetR/AcrR family transcriptional regulator [Nocardioides sp.]